MVKNQTQRGLTTPSNAESHFLLKFGTFKPCPEMPPKHRENPKKCPESRHMACLDGPISHCRQLDKPRIAQWSEIIRMTETNMSVVI